ncbi:MAG: hypothetical protein NG740_01095 [Omnitrophica bacterium]|nr:hypothetical protein [Candidatus Omnitrophota bacterium]
MLKDLFNFYAIKKMCENNRPREDRFMIERIRKERTLASCHVNQNRKKAKKYNSYYQ